MRIIFQFEFYKFCKIDHSRICFFPFLHMLLLLPKLTDEFESHEKVDELKSTIHTKASEGKKH